MKSFYLKKLLFFSGLLRLGYTGVPCSSNPEWHRGSALGETPWSEKGSGISLWAVPGCPELCPKDSTQGIFLGVKRIFLGSHSGNVPGYSGKHRELLWWKTGKKKSPSTKNNEKSDLLTQQLPLCPAPGAGEEWAVPVSRRGQWEEQNKPCRTSPALGESSGWPLLCPLCSFTSIVSINPNSNQGESSTSRPLRSGIS